MSKVNETVKKIHQKLKEFLLAHDEGFTEDDFVLYMTEEVEKIFAPSCRNCYDKGYRSEMTVIRRPADFYGEKTREVKVQRMNFCTCDKGKQLQSDVQAMFPYAEADMVAVRLADLQTMGYENAQDLVDKAAAVRRMEPHRRAEKHTL